MLEAVIETLSGIEAPGTFAVRRYLRPDDLRLEVVGVGRIPLPVSATNARKLCKAGRKAPFGLRDKTLIDARIRDTWQIAKSRVKLDKPRFKAMMAPALEAIQAELGLAQSGKLTAELYKMLVYEPGQFFVPHQDSEKTSDMVGTLLLELPSDYSGGTVSVEHRDRKMTFRRTKRSGQDVTLMAFYADCHHEVKPIKSGYRVVLSFNLRFRAKDSMVEPAAATLAELAGHVRDYFDTELPIEPYEHASQGRPPRLVYLLDHEYTQQSLSWHKLKNGDRTRIGALRAVARELDCVTFLTLADVHEHWACTEDFGGGYGGYGRDYDRYEEDDDEEEEEEDYDGEEEDGGPELTELLESDIELRHWIDADGNLTADILSSQAGLDEVCFTIPSEDLEPFRSHHQGWMGNWGNTVERWYHRAALVMWPRAFDFAVRAEMAPNWAQDQLLEQFMRGEHEQAKVRAEQIQAFWGDAARQEQQPQFFDKALRVARLLDDAALAAQWLQPFRIDRLSDQGRPQLSELLTHYGPAWVQARITGWGSTRFGPETALEAKLVQLCNGLLGSGAPHDRSLAQWLVEREANLLIARCDKVLGAPADDVRHHHENLSELMTHIGHFFEAAAIACSPAQRDRILTALLDTGPTPAPLVLGQLLQALRERHRPKALRAMGLDALHRHVEASLEQLSAAPPRAKDDWSITPPGGCDCADCDVLAAFLRAPDKQALKWPLAKARRQYIHNILDRNNLPVKHTTRRQGSPHKLMLRKLPALFEQDAKLRARQKALLSWLRKQRNAFVSER